MPASARSGERLRPRWLRASPQPLCAAYDVALLDLDGVVYLGREAVPGVPGALAAVRDAGVRLAFVTNNAARAAADVADHLAALGVPAAAADVITSAQVAARHAAEVAGPGARVLALGTDALADELGRAGLVVVRGADARPDAVVQGYSPDLGWRELAEGAVAINGGARWIACNADATLPSARGPLPANGSMVAALAHATGAVPAVVGKPHPTMHAETIRRTGALRPIVVGDRLDTDIEGAAAVGCDSLLVLSGVTAPRDLLAAPPERRPSFVAADAAGLLDPHRAPQPVAGGFRCGGWLAVHDGAAVVLGAHGVAGIESSMSGLLDALRALCATAWASGDPSPRVLPQAAPARDVVARLGLAAD